MSVSCSSGELSQTLCHYQSVHQLLSSNSSGELQITNVPLCIIVKLQMQHEFQMTG